jgi:di/tricarboxylate transporter
MNAWIVGGVYVAVVASLLLRLRASWAFVGGAAVLLVLGQLRPEEWLAAAVNPSLLVLWVLLIAATAIESRFRLESLMPRSGSFGSRLALIWGTGLISTFMNNTAVVALLMAPLRRWAPRQGLSPAVVLMPMAFAATLGGVVTVIGTSTNLVLNGLIRASGTPELGTWDYLIPGLAVLSLGGLYLTWAGRRMFADRALASAARESARPYTVETRLRPGAPEVGQSVERAGFRQLLGLYLVEIQRGAQLIAPVAPGEMLHEGDRLFFAGELEQVDELLRSRTGLALPQAKVTAQAHEAPLVEAMVPPGSPLEGVPVRQSQFRQRLDAAIIGVHRQGERMRGRIGDIALQGGDLLILVAGPRFSERAQETRLLYVLSQTQAPPAGSRAASWTAWGSLALVLGLVAAGTLSLLAALCLWLVVLGALKWLTWSGVRRGLDPELLLMLTSALALSGALQSSGAAEHALNALLPWLQGSSPHIWLLSLLLLTTLLTNFVTNVAALVLMFPLGLAAVQGGFLPATPAYLALAFGASAAFLTPAGYATNLMVMGPGGYDARDFARLGGGLTVLYLALVYGWLISLT